jgi:biopolymer transport protein ExbD
MTNRRLSTGVLFTTACSLLTGCSAPARPPQPPIVVQVSAVDGACRAEAEGREYASEELPNVAQAWRGRLVRVQPIGDAPYRCVGGALFLLQGAGLTNVRLVTELSGGVPKE